jgi:hypothetical protein
VKLKSRQQAKDDARRRVDEGGGNVGCHGDDWWDRMLDIDPEYDMHTEGRADAGGVVEVARRARMKQLVRRPRYSAQPLHRADMSAAHCVRRPD